VRAEGGIPVMADESLVTLEQARQLIDLGACDHFNIRLSKNGGITASLAIAKLAHEAGIKIQVGAQVGETGILSAQAEPLRRICLRSNSPKAPSALGSSPRMSHTKTSLSFRWTRTAPENARPQVTVREDVLERLEPSSHEVRDRAKWAFLLKAAAFLTRRPVDAMARPDGEAARNPKSPAFRSHQAKSRYALRPRSPLRGHSFSQRLSRASLRRRLRTSASVHRVRAKRRANALTAAPVLMFTRTAAAPASQTDPHHRNHAQKSSQLTRLWYYRAFVDHRIFLAASCSVS